MTTIASNLTSGSNRCLTTKRVIDNCETMEGRLEVWVVEACYESEGCYLIGVFDHKPSKQEQRAAQAVSNYQGAEELSVSKWSVKGTKRKANV